MGKNEWWFWLSIWSKWKTFIIIILDPWVLFLLLATGLSIYFSSKTEAKEIQALLNFVISIFSGLLWGVLANKFSQLTEIQVLVARGKGAIRWLKLILLNINHLVKRTQGYIKTLSVEEKDYKLIVSNFEEVIEKSIIIEEEVLSSMENWTDIIPEVADLKSLIGTVSQFKERETELEKELISLQKETWEQNTQKEQELREKEQELAIVKDKLKNAESNFGSYQFSLTSPWSIWDNSWNSSMFYTWTPSSSWYNGWTLNSKK